MSAGDLVRHRDVIGVVGRVVEIVGERALIAWHGYSHSPTWTDLARLVPLERR